jgi:hypothetical protein
MPADIARTSGRAMAAQPPDRTEGTRRAFRMIRSGARQFASARLMLLWL